MPPEEQDNAQGNELMADLAKAWQEVEEDNISDEGTAGEVEAGASTEPEDTTPTASDAAPAGEGDSAPATEPETAAAETTTDDTTTVDEPTAPEKAPAAIREHWADMPEPARQAWQDREAQFEERLQRGAMEANLGRSMMDAVAPFQESLRMEANSPQEAFAQYGQFSMTMRTGTPSQKAGELARLFHHYGVDIHELDNAIADQASNPASTQGSTAPVNDPRVDDMLARENARNMREINNEIKEFAKTAEFLDDVQEDMQMLFEMAAHRGEQLSLQDAYDKACRMNAQVSAILAGRRIAAPQAPVTPPTDPDVSVSGAPSGGSYTSDGSVRGDLEEAMANM